MISNRWRFAFFFFLSCATISGLWWINKQEKPTCVPHIYSYDATTDRAFVLELFKKNWYWLVSEYSPEFSAEYMLDNKASSKQPEHLGNLSLYVYRNPQSQAFLAFYKKSIFLGFILFLVVDEAYRKQGIASCLLEFALNELRQQGCTYVQLLTRVNNHAAQKTYLKHGFYKIWQNEGFVYFQKEL